MKKLIHILSRIILIIIILVIGNIIYSRYFWKEDVSNHADILDSLNKVAFDSDILYFAESSNFTHASDEKDKRSISEMVAEYFPNLKIGTVNKGALHAKLYETLINNIPDSSKVKTLIITMNLRSFGPNWINSDLETPLMKMNELINSDLPKIINRFIFALNTFNNVSLENRNKAMIQWWENEPLSLSDEFPFKTTKEWYMDIFYNGVNNESGVRDSALTFLASHFVKNYAFRINLENNPRIKDFDEILKFAKDRGWNVVYNILAENVYEAKKIVTPELITLIDVNKRLLYSHYTKMGAIVVDNLMSVSNDQFIDRNWPTEHYYEQGRRKIAYNIAQKLNVLYPADYKEIILKNIFFCNMENISDSCWTNLSTISQNKSYSNSHSSFLNSKDSYSIAFVKPVNDLKLRPESIKASCYFYSEEDSVNATIVIELKNNKNSWHGMYLNNFYEKKADWNYAEFQINLEGFDIKGNIIKAYIWTAKNEKLYIDDINVELKYF